MLELIPLPYSLFLIPYLLLKHPLPRLKPWAMVNVVIFEIEKYWNMHTTSPSVIEVATKKSRLHFATGIFIIYGSLKNSFFISINLIKSKLLNILNLTNLINISNLLPKTSPPLPSSPPSLVLPLAYTHPLSNPNQCSHLYLRILLRL